MLRIAICDDDEQQLRQTENLVSAYLRARPGAGGQVESFGSGGALLARAEAAGGFDLYVLDILMPELSGIDTGRRLRALGEGGEIVYLTSSNDFAADSYDVRAFFYLLKPVKENKLFQVLDGAVKKLHQRRSSAVVVTTADGPRRILLERIRYVERVGRCIRTADYLYSVYAPGVDGSTSPNAQVYADDFLYDLKADPDELNNLVGNHAYDAVRDDLRAQLLDWIEQAEGYRPQIVDQA